MWLRPGPSASSGSILRRHWLRLPPRMSTRAAGRDWHAQKQAGQDWRKRRKGVLPASLPSASLQRCPHQQHLRRRSSPRSIGLAVSTSQVRLPGLSGRATFAWPIRPFSMRGQARPLRTRCSLWALWSLGVAKGAGEDWRRRLRGLSGLLDWRPRSGFPLPDARGIRQGRRTGDGAEGAWRRPPVWAMETWDRLLGAWRAWAAPERRCSSRGLHNSQEGSLCVSGTSCRRIWSMCMPQTTTHPPPPHCSCSSSQAPRKWDWWPAGVGSVSKGRVVSWWVCA